MSTNATATLEAPDIKQEETVSAKTANKDDDTVDMTFTKEVRKATKDVHTLTDVLVNAKFAFGMYIHIINLLAF